jgi:hypothetical protein
MNFLPALLEYESKENSKYVNYKINFIKELLNQQLIPQSHLVEFQQLISKFNEIDEDFFSQKNELYSSLEHFSQHVSQKTNAELREMILYISERVKKILNQRDNDPKEIKKLVHQIINELTGSLVQDIQSKFKIRDWLEFAMKEIFENYPQLHDAMFEIFSELLTSLNDLNASQMKTLALYLSYMSSGNGTTCLNYLVDKIFKEFICKNTNTSLDFLSTYLNDCLQFDEIVTDFWSQKYIHETPLLIHRKCCYIPQICLQKIKYILENPQCFEREAFENLMFVCKKVEKIFKRLPTLSLNQWIEFELSFSFNHQNDYFKERLLSNYLCEVNYSISNLSKLSFQYFVKNSIKYDLNNHNSILLLLSLFMIYFEMNKEPCETMWVLEILDETFSFDKSLKKNQFQQIFSILNSTYPQILFLGLNDPKEIILRLNLFIEKFKFFYPFNESLISLYLQGIYFLNVKKNIQFNSTFFFV